MRTRVAACLGLLGLFAVAGRAAEPAYPVKPLRFLVGASAGGGVDATARIVAPRLGAALGQQIVVDNRTGASGNIAAEILVGSPPDGYTVLFGSVGNLAVNVSLYKNLGYHPLRDFAPVTMAVSLPNALVVHPSVAATSVPELIALAKAQPGKLAFGSSGPGNGTHLAGELFKLMAKVDIVHVPYRGGAPAMIDLLAGQIQLMFASAPTAVPQIKAGKIRGLAVTTLKRSALLPELPTIAEAGLPGFEADNWYGIVVAARTPRALVQRLNAELVRILSQPDVKEALFVQGLESSPGTPQALGSYMKSEMEKWAKVIKDAGVQVN